ncbi:hypothetical protein BGZ68_002663 [Mortierella alpina]|nr:hypothetical protein BGZ68_002663 [Mortierella alpina]
MAPPKRSPALTDSAANFFQRGKKPSTTQRVVTVKKSAAAPIALKAKPKQEDEEDEVTDEIENDDTEEEEAFHHSDEDEEAAGDEDEEDHSVLDDTILSDDSDVPVTDMKKKDVASESRLKQETVSKKATETASTKAAKGTRTRGNKKSPTTSYVAPYVGDIYVGFHQADLSDAEKILRQFDLASKFGPCTDVTRLDRWERAFSLGLDPPQHVKDIIVQHEATRNTPLFEGRV